MDRKIYEEPDLVTPQTRYLPFRKYDINTWSNEDNVLNVTAYKLSVYKSDPEEISGTDYDSEYFTWSMDTTNEDDWPAIDWFVCEKLYLPDWTGIDGLDEWTTYDCNTDDYLEATTKPAPRVVKEWIDKLPAYEPRLV
jgi:hypothetical protein